MSELYTTALAEIEAIIERETEVEV